VIIIRIPLIINIGGTMLRNLILTGILIILLINPLQAQYGKKVDRTGGYARILSLGNNPYITDPYFISANLSFEAIKAADEVARNGNPASITDMGVGAQSAYTGVLGGIYNVLINLKDIEDEDFNKKMREDCASLKEEALKQLAVVLEYVESKL
jgi:hypothetical protein